MFKRLRRFSWFFSSLFARYRRLLVIGFFGGLLATMVIGRLGSLLVGALFIPTERIGIVGTYTPSTIPDAILRDISMGLTTLDETGQVMPGLASSWEATDSGKTYRFHLQPNVKWHNDSVVRATDINYAVEGVTFLVINDTTIEAQLPDAYAAFPALVAKPLVLPGLIGSGDYEVTRIRLNDEFVASLLLTSRVGKPRREYRFFRTEEQAQIAYMRGIVDVIRDVSNVEPYQQLPQTIVTQQPRFSRVVALYFNLTKDVLQERPFRQALAYATPQFDQVQRARSPIPETSWVFNNQVKSFAYDPEQARKLLATVQLPDDFPGITISTFQAYVETADVIARHWEEVGIPTQVQIVTQLDDTYDVLLSAHEIPPDPDQYPLWHSKQEDTNITKYANVRVDKLLEDGRKEIDPEKRKTIYQEFQRYVVEDAPVVWLFHPTTTNIERKMTFKYPWQ